MRATSMILVLVYVFLPDGETTTYKDSGSQRAGIASAYYQEIIKQQLLRKLGLDHAPVVANSTRMPFMVPNDVTLQEREAARLDADDEDHSTMYIPADFTGCREKSMMEVEIPARILRTKTIRTAVAWLPIKGRVGSGLGRVWLTAEGTDGAARSRRSAEVKLTDKRTSVRRRRARRVHHWHSFDLSRLLRLLKPHDLDDPRLTVRVSVEFNCSARMPKNKVKNRQRNSRTSMKKPVLMLTFSEETEIRVKRQQPCTVASKDCCGERVTIRFSDIGFDSWVVRPKEFETHQCRGKCIMTPRNTNTAVLKRLPDSRTVAEQTKSCCTGVKFGKLNILYINQEDGLMYQKLVLDLIVDKCGCV